MDLEQILKELENDHSDSVVLLLPRDYDNLCIELNEFFDTVPQTHIERSETLHGNHIKINGHEVHYYPLHLEGLNRHQSRIVSKQFLSTLKK